MIEKILLVINGLKSFAKYLVIPTGVIILLPEKWLSFIKLIEVKNAVGMWISCVFITSLSILVIDGIARIISKFNERRKHQKERKSQRNFLLNLNKTEKAIIKKIYENDSAIFDLSDAHVSKLESMQAIFRPNLSVRMMKFSFCLQPWVIEHLKKTPNFLNEVNCPIETTDYYE